MKKIISIILSIFGILVVGIGIFISSTDQNYDTLVSEQTELTLADVKQLSKKGEQLTWSDFKAFKGIETGSGLHIRIYPVGNDYNVWIGGGSEADRPLYIRLKNHKTGATMDIRTESVEQFLAEEVQIEDLKATELIAPEKLLETKYPLIAKLGEDDIYLYGQPNGVVIKYGENIQVFDWDYKAPRFVLPTLAKDDIDEDGIEELICILRENSEKGVPTEVLHVLKKYENRYTDHVFDDYGKQLRGSIVFLYRAAVHQIEIKTDMSSYIYTIRPENQALTFKNLNYMRNIDFDFLDTLKIKLPVALVFKEQAKPIFAEGVEFVGEIGFQSGGFWIKKIEIVETIE